MMMSFTPATTNTITAEGAQQTAHIDAHLVNNFMDAVVNVLGTMSGTQVALKELLPALDYKPQGDVSSIIGISGEHGEGMVALAFYEPLAKKLVSRLLGLQTEELSQEDLMDGIGELVNMISGKAKTGLSEASGVLYRLSLPSIIKGADHQIAGRPKNCPFMCMVFEAEGETFTLQVSFRQF